MKEKSFRFRESFGNAIKAMTDKQAGQFIKSLCDYAFEEKVLCSNDTILRSNFTLVKMAMDIDRRDRENGRRGGIKSAELRKRTVKENVLGLDGFPIGEMLSAYIAVVNDNNNQEKSSESGGEKSVAK